MVMPLAAFCILSDGHLPRVLQDNTAPMNLRCFGVLLGIFYLLLLKNFFYAV
jgi:hypothetical protein